MKGLTTQSHAPHITNDSPPIRQGYKWTEVGVIPEDWETQRLDAICSVYSGGTPSTARHDFYGGHIPWITSGDLNARRITEVSNYLTQAGFDSSAAKMVESGDLVVALYGATAGVVAVTEIEAAINQAVLSIRTNRCDSEYLFHHLASRRNQIVATYTQGGQPNLSGEIIRSLVIVIPPLVEQRAIAEALSDVDGLLNALEALIAKKRAIKQATMQQLLTGRTRLPGFRGVWETKRLGELGNCLRGVSYDPTTDLSSYDKDSTVRLLRANNIQEAAVILADVQYVEARKVSEFQVMQPDDILVCMANGSKELVGKAGLFFVKDGYTYTFGAFMGCFRVEPTIAEPNFVFYIFQTHRFRNFINLILAGSSINNLKPSDIESAEFQVPDKEEQRAIVSVLSDMDAEIVALEQRRDKTRAIKQGMMQQLLTGRVRLMNKE